MSGEDGYAPVLLACIGRRMLANNALGIGFVPADNLTGEPMFFAERKRSRDYRAGGIYEVEMNDTKARLTGAAGSYRKMVSDPTVIACWQVEETAAKAEQAAFKRHKSDLDAAIVIAFAPLREEYIHRNTVGRLAIEVAVLSYLRYGRS